MTTPANWLEHTRATADIQGFELLAHHDLGGHGDGFQVIRKGDVLYVAHLGQSPMALSILDVSDIRNPRLVRQIEHPENTRSHKVQVVGNTLIQNNELPYWAKGESVTGLSVYDVSDPFDPKPVGFHPSTGEGVHRLWYHEAPYAHIASYQPGGRKHSYEIVDLSDPAHPVSVGSWSVPGTFDGDEESWRRGVPQEFMGVHGVIPSGDRAYVAAMDGGVVILDISDLTSPRFLGRVSWSPPFGGFVHTTLPLPGRGLVVASSEGLPAPMQTGDKRIWIVDVRDDSNPVTISTMPEPVPPAASGATTYADLPGIYGPHNLHENRPGSYIDEELIFATYSNAGLRVWNIANQFQPREVAHFVPPAWTGQDASALNDLYVDEERNVFVTDRHGGGLYVLRYAE